MVESILLAHIVDWFTAAKTQREDEDEDEDDFLGTAAKPIGDWENEFCPEVSESTCGSPFVGLGLG